jgi:hypothetical protein
MADVVRNGQANGLSDRSTAELVKLASEQISRLVRDELQLARAELQQKGRRAGVGAGLLGGGGFLAMYGLAAVLTALIIGLAAVMPDWLAALLVGVVLFVVAGVLALLGRRQVRGATPPVPTEAARSVRADVETVTEAVRDGRHR